MKLNEMKNASVQVTKATESNKPCNIGSISKNFSTINHKKDLERVRWNKYQTIVHYEKESDYGGKKAREITEIYKFLKLYPCKEGRPIIKKIEPRPVEENVMAILEHYNISLKLNIMTGSVDIFYENCLIEEKLEESTSMILDICEKQSFKIKKDKLVDALRSIARRNKYNPIEEYLKECHHKWSGENYLKKMCNTITVDNSLLPEEEKEIYIEKFLLQMVTLVTSEDNSTIASQFLLVLLGAQGIGKTTWLKNLLPKRFQVKYFLGGRSLDLNNKDNILETTNNWLAEMGEISSTFKKSDQEVLKAFITASKDRVRPPYGSEAIDRKRRTSFCGTTNDERYLTDVTGNRRYLTLPCIKINYDHNINVDQLWGQIYDMVLKGEICYFTPEENEHISQQNERYRIKSKLQEQLEQYFELYPKTNCLPEMKEITSQDIKEKNPFWDGEFMTSREIVEYIDKNRATSEKVPEPASVGKGLSSIKVFNIKKKNLGYYYVKKI